MDFFSNIFFLVAITLGYFFMAKYIQSKTKLLILNPILLSIIFIIATLLLTGVDYETYHEAGKYIDFWLQPTVVALGVPLYLQLKDIKKQWLPILFSQLAGCVVGLVSVTVIAKLLGATPEVIASLAPKSVTTPIAIEVCKALEGIPSLTAAVVIVVGIFGAVLGFQILQVGRITNPMAQSISMGTASHALGASKAMELNKDYGAWASLGLTLNGIFTALLSPIILDLLGVLK